MTKLIAKRPILYLAKQYMTGDILPQNDYSMVELWLKYDSAMFEKEEKKTSKATKGTK